MSRQVLLLGIKGRFALKIVLYYEVKGKLNMEVKKMLFLAKKKL